MAKLRSALFVPFFHVVIFLHKLTPISHRRAGMQRPLISMFYDPIFCLVPTCTPIARVPTYPHVSNLAFVRTSRSTPSSSAILLRSIHFLCHSLSIQPLCDQTSAAFYSLTLLVPQHSHRIVLPSHYSPLSEDLFFNSRKYNANKN